MLPSDELVRVTCVKRETRVRDLLRHLRAQVTTALVVAREDKQQQQKKKPTTREQEKEVVLAKGDRRSQQVFPLSSSNHRAALERLAFAKQHGGDNAVVAVAWELVLVRTGLGTCRSIADVMDVELIMARRLSLCTKQRSTVKPLCVRVYRISTFSSIAHSKDACASPRITRPFDQMRGLATPQLHSHRNRSDPDAAAAASPRNSQRARGRRVFILSHASDD